MRWELSRMRLGVDSEYKTGMVLLRWRGQTHLRGEAAMRAGHLGLQVRRGSLTFEHLMNCCYLSGCFLQCLFGAQCSKFSSELWQRVPASAIPEATCISDRIQSRCLHEHCLCGCMRSGQEWLWHGQTMCCTVMPSLVTWQSTSGCWGRFCIFIHILFVYF